MAERVRVAGSFVLRFVALALGLLSACYSQSPATSVVVVSAADYRSYVAPESLAALFGTNLSDSVVTGQLDDQGQLGTNLAGTTVQVCGELAGLLVVSPKQINFAVPADLKPGLCPVIVTTKGGSSSGTADIRPVSPAFFTADASGTGRAAALNAVTFKPGPFSVLTPESPSADKGTRLALFGTGFRNVINAALPGFSRSAILAGLITDSSGKSLPVNVEYVGPAPGFVGLDQLNIALPASVDGAALIFFTLIAGSVRSNTVILDISNLGALIISDVTPVAGPPGSVVSVLGQKIGTKEMLAAGRVAVALVEPNGFRLSVTPDFVDLSRLTFTMPAIAAGTSILYSGPLAICVRVDSAETCSNSFTVTPLPSGAPGQTFLSVTGAALQSAVVALNQLGATQVAQGLSTTINGTMTQYADLVNKAVAGSPKTLTFTRADGTQATVLIDAAFINRLDQIAAVLQPLVTGPSAFTGTTSSSVLQPSCADSDEQALQTLRDTLRQARSTSKAIIQTAALAPVESALNSCVGTTTADCITNASLSATNGEAAANLLTGLLYYPLLATIVIETQPVFLDSIQILPPQVVAAASSPSGPTVSALLLPLGQGANVQVQGHLLSALPSLTMQQIVTQAASDALASLALPAAGGLAIPKCDVCLKILQTCPQCAAAMLQLNANLVADLSSVISSQLSAVSPNVPTKQVTDDVQLTSATTSLNPVATSEVAITNACSQVPALVTGLRTTSGTYEPFRFTVDPGVLPLSNEISTAAQPGSVWATLNVAVGPAAPPLALQSDKASYSNRELAYVVGSGFPSNTPVSISLSGPSLAEKVEVSAFTDSLGTLSTFVPLYDAQQSGTYVLSAFVQNSVVRASASISIAPARLVVQVSPQQGTFSTSPQILTVSAAGAARIYYSVNQATGSIAATPPLPSAVSNDGVITGSGGRIQLTGTPGQLNSWSYIFAAEDANGAGSASPVYNFSIDLRNSVNSPQLASIKTTPAVPLDGQAFSFLLAGTNFDPTTAQVSFAGPGCPGTCVVRNINLSKSATEVFGSVSLPGGRYTVTLQNGSFASSNAISFNVAFGTPSIAGISTSPGAPAKGQAFDFTITGSSFDPATAIVAFTGPGCPATAKCLVPNNALWSKSSTQLSGTGTLSDGTFTVTVQNGPTGTPSVAAQLSILGARVTAITTTPNPPVAGVAFAFTITGANFDPNSVIVTFSGPGCTPTASCTIPASALSNVSSTQLSGTAVLGGGTFTVTVQNGPTGGPSNALVLTVSGTAVGVPQLNAISTAPSPPVGGQTFSFTISGTNFDPNSTVVVFVGPGCLASAPCIVSNVALSAKTSTQLSGATTLPGGSFVVTVQNGSSGTASNGLALIVSGGTQTGPVVNTINTSPGQPVSGSVFTITINGSGFDPATATVIFTGPGCTTGSSCSITNSQLAGKSATQLSGVMTLTAPGNYTVTVQNGASGTASNSQPLIVSGSTGTLQLIAIATSPNPPLNGQTFNFTLTGAGFDPATAQVIFTGPGCASACSVANSQLTSKTATQLSGSFTLAGGQFTVTVQNSSGSPSNSLALNVAGNLGTAPQFTAITTAPTSPVGAQPFTFTITGAGFDPASATVFFSGPGCGASSTCTIENTGLSTPTATQLAGTAVLAGGTYVVTVVNGPTGSPSNQLTLTVSFPAGSGPQLTSVTTAPNPPVGGQAFTFTIAGSGFDPSTIFVTLSGPGCTPCTVSNSALTSKTATAMSGSTTLSAGSFSLTVQNGSSGAPSNALALTVSGASGPQLTTVTTTPNPATAGQSFTFTIAGTGIDPNTALVSFTGPGCTPCTISNASLTTKTSTQVAGPATLASAGSYNVTVQNGSGTTASNGLTLTVAASTGGPAPQVSSVTTTPNPPVAGQSFTFTVSGIGFDPTTALISFAGPGCTPCTIANSALSSKTSTLLSGTTSLAQAGNFTVTVQNGSTGAASAGVALTVSANAAAPLLAGITTVPSSPVAGQSFTFTISGSAFDPATALVLFTGPGCSPCSITNGSLTSKTATQLSGSASLSAGTFTVTVQNGSTGTASNGVTLTVSSASGGGPALSSVTTSPNPPVAGQSFTFTISGTGFDPSTALVSFVGPGCTTPCIVSNASLTSKTSTQLSGTTTLATAGSFTVTVQNGSAGSASNGVAVTVSSASGGGGPQLSGVTTTPSPAVVGQAFTFTVTGTGFDPSTVLVSIAGPGCSSPCIISNGSLASKTSTQVTGTTTLNSAGSYTITVQNGSSASASNSQQITVSASSGGGGIQLTGISTTPTTPVHNQNTQFILFGSGFDANTSMVVFSGPGCTPAVCTIPNSDIFVNNQSTAIGGNVTLPSSGTYTVKVQNGSGGPSSNSLNVTAQ